MMFKDNDRFPKICIRKGYIFYYFGFMRYLCLIMAILTLSCRNSAEQEHTPALAGVKSLSERDMNRALGKSCDTSFYFMDDSVKFDHDTGYIVGDLADEPYLGEHRGLSSGKWEIASYKQTGPDSYRPDEKKKLPLYQRVKVLDSFLGQTKKSWHGWRGRLLVGVVGSEEKYMINVDNFTFKDPRQCGLVQKASNHFFTKAVYAAPADSSMRPLSMGYEEKWIDVPSHATMIVAGYDPERKLIRAGIYNKSGEFVGDGQFFEGTLTEVK
jgi:hypothetical protein